ncbi:MAG TPA: hypothetical protein VMI72_19120 [Roseiarcus sp.]|nr:hypothetical protein [Roseiarcus sp.]
MTGSPPTRESRCAAVVSTRRKPALALGDAAAEQGERLAEKGADEVGLYPPRLRALHLLADRGHGIRVHVL